MFDKWPWKGQSDVSPFEDNGPSKGASDNANYRFRPASTIGIYLRLRLESEATKAKPRRRWLFVLFD